MVVANNLLHGWCFGSVALVGSVRLYYVVLTRLVELSSQASWGLYSEAP